MLTTRQPAVLRCWGRRSHLWTCPAHRLGVEETVIFWVKDENLEEAVLGFEVLSGITHIFQDDVGVSHGCAVQMCFVRGKGSAHVKNKVSFCISLSYRPAGFLSVSNHYRESGLFFQEVHD